MEGAGIELDGRPARRAYLVRSSKNVSLIYDTAGRENDLIGALVEIVARTEPQTFIGTLSGGLGVSPGAAFASH